MKKNERRHRILFVCMGNICRSPAAEMIFRKMIRDTGRENDFTIDSAGTIGFHAGKAPDTRMASTLRARGYEIFGGARQLREEDLDHYDLIVTMDDENAKDVADLVTSPEQEAKIRPLVSFCTRYDATEVPDPYYGGQKGFDHAVALLEDGCTGILAEFPA